uniref:Pre-rRNA-processing protein TSR2 homolog n=1 Tax=Timema genevievae TaxID=629358 RepID=A0A7R9KAS8_TIMGE|nr:unnamed protein product [Timema genevievae]
MSEDILERAVKSVFNNWEALKMAANLRFSGVESLSRATNFVEAVVDLINNKDCDYYDLLDLLEDTMDEQFDTYIEDGSLEEVATLLKSFHDSFKSGNTEQLLQDINFQPNSEQWLLAWSEHTSCKADDATAESCAMETSEEVSHASTPSAVSPRQDPMDDGWTQVTRRKK